MTNNKTFISITNKDIYSKVCNIETHVLKINEKVKLNKWISSTALTLSLGLIMIIVGVKVW